MDANVLVPSELFRKALKPPDALDTSAFPTSKTLQVTPVLTLPVQSNFPAPATGEVLQADQKASLHAAERQPGPLPRVQV